jgi:hypothetical protein
MVMAAPGPNGPDVVAFGALPFSGPAAAAQRVSHLSAAALAFLQLEATNPQRWRTLQWPCSVWTLKDGVLRTFGAMQPSPAVAEQLRELVLGAVARQHRCKDYRYWQLARRLDDPHLRAGLSAAAEAAIESTRLRARFVQWLLEHPDQRADAPGWRRWLPTHGQPLPPPVAQRLAQLGSSVLRRPARAAALLADWPTDQLTLVLDSVERGHATQIAAALPKATAAAALAGMDARRANQTLRGMAEPTAAAILELMPPAAAASRLPGPSRPHILALMHRDAATRCLRCMTTAEATHRIRYLPAEVANALINEPAPARADVTDHRHSA